MQGARISRQLWGTHQDKPVYLFRIVNSKGAFAEISNYGATLVSVHVPDRDHKLGNVVLGFPTLQGYLDDRCYIGATIGRFANRIGGAGFVLDGKTYLLDDNDNGNSNHGGDHGFNSKVFDFSIDGDVISFNLLSENGEGGFPGNLVFKVSYQWSDHNELLIEHQATTDQRTPVSFTSHAYFNLTTPRLTDNGQIANSSTAGDARIFDHELTIYAGSRLVCGADHIPSGLIVPAASLSFNKNLISENVIFSEGAISGLNTCYVLDKNDHLKNENGQLKEENDRPAALACLLTDPLSGRTLEVLTSYPALLLYTGDYLHSDHPGHYDKYYGPFDGLCLECQYFPDSPNHPHFPSAILDPGAEYKERILFKFSIKP